MGAAPNNVVLYLASVNLTSYVPSGYKSIGLFGLSGASANLYSRLHIETASTTSVYLFGDKNTTYSFSCLMICEKL